MYNVLIADDEMIMRESLTEMVEGIASDVPT